MRWAGNIAFIEGREWDTKFSIDNIKVRDDLRNLSTGGENIKMDLK
jgi:hypothetical protein